MYEETQRHYTEESDIPEMEVGRISGATRTEKHIQFQRAIYSLYDSLGRLDSLRDRIQASDSGPDMSPREKNEKNIGLAEFLGSGQAQIQELEQEFMSKVAQLEALLF